MTKLDLMVLNEQPEHLARFESLLAETTYSTEFIGSAKEALEILKESRPKILVIPLSMASMSGEDFMVEFSQYKIWGDMRILVLSEEELPKASFFELASLGASDVVPFDSDQETIMHKLNQLYSSEM